MGFVFIFTQMHSAKQHFAVPRSNPIALPKMYEYTYQSRCATQQSSSRQLEVGAHIERGTSSDDPEVRSSNETICE
jgi:hypothetical protein